MGKTRKNELYKACHTLGIDKDRVLVYNHTHLPDAIEARWPIEIVSRLISNQIEALDIDTIVTFDKHGVSYHLNHCSIYYAVAHLTLEKKLPKSLLFSLISFNIFMFLTFITDCSVYVLETVNIIRKYWFLLDLPVSYLMSRTRYWFIIVLFGFNQFF